MGPLDPTTMSGHGTDPGVGGGPVAPAGDHVLSGVQPSGDLHLGNYLGALRNWVAHQHDHDAFYCVVDLHALTLDIDPEELRRTDARCRRQACWPSASTPRSARSSSRATSPSITRLAWLLECTATMGELRRMTQFKDKGAGRPRRCGSASSRTPSSWPPTSCSTTLTASRWARTSASTSSWPGRWPIRFNHRYGRDFTVPEAPCPSWALGDGSPAPPAQDVQVGRLPPRHGGHPRRSAEIERKVKLDRFLGIPRGEFAMTFPPLMSRMMSSYGRYTGTA